MTQQKPELIREPSSLDVAIVFGILIALLAASYMLFGKDAVLGPNQVALIFSSVIAGIIAHKNGMEWEGVSQSVVDGVAAGPSAIFILLAVGALIGSWALSGALAAMIFYGLEFLNPDYFYISALALCALLATAVGSSWTVIGTIGVGLMGIAPSLGMSPEITAGAIVSEAFFGDRTSPLSDTLNLATALRLPPFVKIFAGALVGGIVTAVLNPQVAIEFAGDATLPAPIGILKGVWLALSTGFVSHTGEPTLDELLSRRGMSHMLNTIWLIMSALAFGALVEHAGLVQRIVNPIAARARTIGGLIASVAVCCIGTNIVTADQYILSAATLAISTVSFAGFAFFCLLSPIMTVVIGAPVIRIIRIEPKSRIRTSRGLGSHGRFERCVC